MVKFVDWLSLEWNWRRIFVAPFAFALIWVAVDYWTNAIYPGYGPDWGKEQYPSWKVLFFSQPQAALAAFMEELLFRLVPLCLAVAIWYKSRWILAVAVCSSFIFAASHNAHHLMVIVNHTTFGLAMSFLFLKCGGFRKNDWWGPTKALLITTIAHTLSNLGQVSLWWSLSRWKS